MVGVFAVVGGIASCVGERPSIILPSRSDASPSVEDGSTVSPSDDGATSCDELCANAAAGMVCDGFDRAEPVGGVWSLAPTSNTDHMTLEGTGCDRAFFVHMGNPPSGGLSRMLQATLPAGDEVTADLDVRVAGKPGNWSPDGMKTLMTLKGADVQDAFLQFAIDNAGFFVAAPSGARRRLPPLKDEWTHVRWVLKLTDGKLTVTVGDVTIPVDTTLGNTPSPSFFLVELGIRSTAGTGDLDARFDNVKVSSK